MHMHNQNITGIFLAGGMSKRMGQDKGKIKIGNRFLYQYALNTLEQVCDEIIISTCNKSNDFDDHRIVCDDIPGVGPIGGISSCLKESGTELNIVLSYDLPLVNKELLSYLINETGDYDVVVPALQVDKTEPLCGIYRKNVVEKFDRAIQEKNYAVHSIFKMVKFKISYVTKNMPFYSPHLFLNINTAEDLEQLKFILKQN
jgi:molybdenum cofactor guanylyltransferase